jgi:competence protein ComEC
VLKIGNHGEGDATSRAFVDAVRPSLAVISTNTEDEPDTPDPNVLKILKSWEIPVLITQDTEEGILVTLRGGEIITEMK